MKEEMLFVADKLNLLLSQLENTAATAYLVKEGILYADAEADISARAVEFLVLVLDQMTTALKEIKKLIAEKEDIEA